MNAGGVMKKRLELVSVLVVAVLLSVSGLVAPSRVYAYDGEDDSAIEAAG
jgi:hypothetical protein